MEVASNYCTHGLQVKTSQSIEKMVELPEELYSPTSPTSPIMGMTANFCTQLQVKTGQNVEKMDELPEELYSPTSPTMGVTGNCKHLQMKIGQSVEKMDEFPEAPYSPSSPTSPTIGVTTNYWTQSDTEDEKLDTVEDIYFKNLEDNFVNSAVDARRSVFDLDAVDDIEGGKRQSKRYAELAIQYYNEDQKNEVKYELIRAIMSVGMMGKNGLYGHVNFIAKAKLEDSKEELFFAELHYNHDKLIMMPTCFYSLEGKEQVGGCKELEGECAEDIDLRLCYACPKSMLHPEDGILYQCGHFTSYWYYN